MKLDGNSKEAQFLDLLHFHVPSSIPLSRVENSSVLLPPPGTCDFLFVSVSSRMNPPLSIDKERGRNDENCPH